MSAFLGTCAVAGITFIINRYRNFFLAAENSFLESQLDIYIYVSAFSGAVSSCTATAAKAAEAKHTAENIAQIAHVKALTIEAAASARC